ncbi:hypothetical protein [Poritiphilus flavus]|uniref:Uncharacterized protein n=1 Tax=Poritiphilus flavus TaxID=2697053 RepID=A0A6L9EDH2_9FLAO|nr:hypothetical protein [Poritiphilus flavus]NAS12682.1 hypothetical protein [Poritiphilus flavus]
MIANTVKGSASKTVRTEGLSDAKNKKARIAIRQEARNLILAAIFFAALIILSLSQGNLFLDKILIVSCIVFGLLLLKAKFSNSPNLK